MVMRLAHLMVKRRLVTLPAGATLGPETCVLDPAGCCDGGAHGGATAHASFAAHLAGSGTGAALVSHPVGLLARLQSFASGVASVRPPAYLRPRLAGSGAGRAPLYGAGAGSFRPLVVGGGAAGPNYGAVPIPHTYVCRLHGHGYGAVPIPHTFVARLIGGGAAGPNYGAVPIAHDYVCRLAGAGTARVSNPRTSTGAGAFAPDLWGQSWGRSDTARAFVGRLAAHGAGTASAGPIGAAGAVFGAHLAGAGAGAVSGGGGRSTACCAGTTPSTLTATLSRSGFPAFSGHGPIAWDGTEWVGDVTVGCGETWTIHLKCNASVPQWQFAVEAPKGAGYSYFSVPGSGSFTCSPFSVDVTTTTGGCGGVSGAPFLELVITE